MAKNKPKALYCPLRKTRVVCNEKIGGVTYEFEEEFCSCLKGECAWWVEYADPEDSRCALRSIAESGE